MVNLNRKPRTDLLWVWTIDRKPQLLILLFQCIPGSYLHRLEAARAADSLAAQRPDNLEDLLATNGLQNGHIERPRTDRQTTSLSGLSIRLAIKVALFSTSRSLA